MLFLPRFIVPAALRRRIGGRLLTELERRVRRAAALLHIDEQRLAGLGLRIVDDAEMARLHLRYMGEPGPTDVLSFVPDEDLAGADMPELLGDIAINWHAVERQAAAPSSRARLDEASVLLVHGLAHLLGHDHGTRHEGRRMHRLERRVLARLQVADPPRPYAPRLASTWVEGEP